MENEQNKHSRSRWWWVLLPVLGYLGTILTDVVIQNYLQKDVTDAALGVLRRHSIPDWLSLFMLFAFISAIVALVIWGVTTKRRLKQSAAKITLLIAEQTRLQVRQEELSVAVARAEKEMREAQLEAIDLQQALRDMKDKYERKASLSEDHIKALLAVCHLELVRSESSVVDVNTIAKLDPLVLQVCLADLKTEGLARTAATYKGTFWKLTDEGRKVALEHR